MTKIQAILFSYIWLPIFWFLIKSQPNIYKKNEINSVSPFLILFFYFNNYMIDAMVAIFVTIIPLLFLFAFWVEDMQKINCFILTIIYFLWLIVLFSFKTFLLKIAIFLKEEIMH